MLMFVCSSYTDRSTTLRSRKFFHKLESRPSLTYFSDYSAKVFGFATFGKVYGLIICLAGLLNFSQSGLDAATHKLFKKNPIPVNVMLLGLALLVGIALVAFVWRRSHKIMRENVEDEAEGAREQLMPGGEESDVRDYGAVNGNGASASGEDRGRRL